MAELSEGPVDGKKLGQTADRFVTLLKDREAQQKLREMFDETQQTQRDLIVKDVEKDLWKTAAQQQSLASQSSTRLPVLTATATNSPGKD
ncbi:MAG: hypothetical protein R2747_08030 [Pyrinomonadaceae bacterium]